LRQKRGVPLTLREVCGLTTEEIARAFITSAPTLAQRIVRAKAKIREARIPYQVPSPAELPERLDAVLQVVYLVFNEGYAASSGDEVHRLDLCREAIRIARLLIARLPNDGEVIGLLALMLLTDARRDARTGPSGELVPLDEQDRSRWDRAMIAEGIALATRALVSPIGAYGVQAAIAALHDEAPSTEATDWPQVLTLYGLLARIDPSPMVSLNAAIATAMVHGPAAGLAKIDAVADDPRLAATHRVDAVRAHLLERLGDLEAAAGLYLRASERTASTPERDYLRLRASTLYQRTKHDPTLRTDPID
jgi:predicted RNA polymerase sigma factor